MVEQKEHVDLIEALEALEADDFMVDWFKDWAAAVAKKHDAPLADDVLPLRETILEAVSDASAEQFLNPLTARHLRRFGERHFASHDLWFWVRSEWSKVDLCYGLSRKDGFADWNRAWTDGDTGDLGQIEAKVFYAHETSSKRNEKWTELKRELNDRVAYSAPTRNRRKQRFYGLVWLFQHDGCNGLADLRDEIRNLATRESLTFLRSAVETPVADDLGRLWPLARGRYQCGLDLMLLELTSG